MVRVRTKVAAGIARGLAAGGALAMLAAGPAPAQDIKVNVTGSNIKRIEGETALPVQVITREEINNTGVVNAAELLDRLAVNSSVLNYPLAEAFGDSARIGFGGASLRGLGFNRTLILLNGRRLANYAHDGTAVDLNAIPLSAIERVEVLKDGASAIYGTDAIGGVINFILRNNYQGVEVSAYGGDTWRGGADEYSFTGTAGFGDLSKDRYNAFFSAQYFKSSQLLGGDRPWSNSAYMPIEGVDTTSGRSFPANVFIPGVGNVNPRYPNCAPSLTPRFEDYGPACRFDPSPFLGSLPESKRFNFVARGTVQWAPDHQLFGEATYTKNEYRFLLQPAPISQGTLFPAAGPDAPAFLLPPTSPFYPHDFAAQYGLDGQPLNIQWRPFDLGLRDSTTTSEQTRIVLGGRGNFRGWDYEAAYSYNQSKDVDHLNAGYSSQSLLLPLLASGNVNPFDTNSPAIIQALHDTWLQADARNSKSTVNAVDGKISNDIYQLPAGPLAMALGGEWRHEKLDQISAPILSTGDIVGYGTAAPSVQGSRDAYAFFVEFNAPIVKTLELNAAARYDHYSDFGSTTNPKISLRWQPNRNVLLRASYGTGFRAPSLPEQLTPTTVTNTQPGLSDPVRCPVTNDTVNDCNTQFVSIQGGNTNLEPEKSKQWTVGGLWEPLDGLSVGVDWFKTDVKNLIGILNPAVILADVNQYAAFITRGAVDPNFPTLPGPITEVISTYANLGETRITGIDVDLRYRTPALPYGRFTFSLNGTYYIHYDVQQNDGSFAGQIGLSSGALGAIQRWRHYAVVDWVYGPWGVTLAQNFAKGYTDQNLTESGDTRRVGNLEVYDIQARYTGFKNWTFTLGVKNLFDRAPPFSNQNFSFQSGYDPSYADPRGGFYYGSIGYKFN